MQKNQYTFEVARDLITMIKRLEPGETIAISVRRHEGGSSDLLDWTSSNGETCGCSESARRIADAYQGNSA